MSILLSSIIAKLASVSLIAKIIVATAVGDLDKEIRILNKSMLRSYGLVFLSIWMMYTK